ncbi:hypothetical protein NAMH_1456 [Nautilia profundicola AmH]|uniref:Uncharacterized protein n=1 Tax=Nautilia profundicola (strain ATCC BAA-1463 / DSM 18972 / AmH) TaxID=598659 RepID=B9L660_NAUPA|nr:hypothetical protein [Nautilia profundicola]ACM92095.1 hypothetical protein NAMH_1456 [Nautilia profundicola AmH]
MKRGGLILFFFTAFLYAASLNVIYSVSTNALKSLDFKNDILLYSTVKKIYLYNLLTKQKQKKHIDNILEAKLNATGDKIVVLNKYDGINIFDNNFKLISKFPGEFQGFVLKDYILFGITNKNIKAYDLTTNKIIINIEKRNIKSVDFIDSALCNYLIAAAPNQVYIDRFYDFRLKAEKRIALKGIKNIKKIKFIDDNKFLLFMNNEVDIFYIDGSRLQKIDFGYRKIKAVDTFGGKVYIATDKKIYVYENVSQFTNTETYDINQVDVVDLSVNGEYIAVGGKYKVYVYSIAENGNNISQIQREEVDENTTYNEISKKNENLFFNLDVNPKVGKAPLEVSVDLVYDFDSSKIDELKISFDNSVYDIIDKKIREFDYVFQKPGIHKIEVEMKVGDKTLVKKIYVKAIKE